MIVLKNIALNKRLPHFVGDEWELYMLKNIIKKIAKCMIVENFFFGIIGSLILNYHHQVYIVWGNWEFHAHH